MFIYPLVIAMYANISRHVRCISSHVQKVTYTEPGGDGCSHLRAIIIFFVRPGGSVGRKPETEIFL